MDTKAKLEELAKDNEDLLSKILDVMNKVFESEKLRFEAEDNTKAITERKEALEKELLEAKQKLGKKEAELRPLLLWTMRRFKLHITKARLITLSR